MPTDYVCEHCETEVETGLTACPACGQPFDTPVPATVPRGEILPDPTPVPLPSQPPPDNIALKITGFIVFVLLACLYWLWHNGAFLPGGGYLPVSR